MSTNTISAITITTGDTYQLKDSIAREKIEKKIYIKDKENECNDDLSVIKLSNEDYAKLVSEEKCLSNAIYILDDTFDDAYGRVLSNLGMTDDDVPSEAANKHYVDSSISSLAPLSDVSELDLLIARNATNIAQNAKNIVSATIDIQSLKINDGNILNKINTLSSELSLNEKTYSLSSSVGVISAIADIITMLHGHAINIPLN